LWIDYIIYYDKHKLERISINPIPFIPFPLSRGRGSIFERGFAPLSPLFPSPLK